MDKNLDFNSRLFSFNGVIGRYNFFLNYICIAAISYVLLIPYQVYILSNLKSFFEHTNSWDLFAASPLSIKLLQIIVVLVSGILYCSNIFRRMNDITGKVSLNINILCSIIYFCSAFTFLSSEKLLPVFYTFMLTNLIITIILLSIKGKITSQMPADNNKIFNWGAFLGTWIWGLFNKSYIPLFMLLLWFTPLGLYFSIYCGLKGNEWAFRNKKEDNIDKFNESQRNQAIIFSIISLVLVPIIFFISIIGIIAGIREQVINNPELRTKLNVFAEQAKESIYSAYFVSHEITQNENKYYIQPDLWNTFSFSDKTKVLDLAASYAAEERTKTSRLQNPSNPDRYQKSGELPRTKIYNVQNLELLAEFKNNTPVNAENQDISAKIRNTLESYKFYTPTEKNAE